MLLTDNAEINRIRSCAPDLHYRGALDSLLYQRGVLPREACHRDAPIDDHFELTRYAYERLRMTGVTPPPYQQTANVMNRSMGSSDLPSFINNVIGIFATVGFNQGAEVYQHCMGEVGVRDFKIINVPRLMDLPQMEEVPEGSEIPYGAFIDDGTESTQVTTWYRQFSFSRQTMANGVVDALIQPSIAIGARARRTERDRFYEVLQTNGNMSDGAPLFGSTHANDATSGAAPGTMTLDDLRALMAGHTSPAGDLLNIRPAFLLGPPEYESAFSAVRQASNAPDPRGVSTSVLSTLTDAVLTGTSPWYGFADPKQFAAITLFHITGQRFPILEHLPRPPLSAPEGTHFRLKHDFVIAATDWRGVARNSGA